MGERLSTLAASFVALERRGLPMHVAALVILKPTGSSGPLTADELNVFVANRLRRLPMLRKRLTSDPFGLGRAEWSAAAPIDLSGHVYRHRLSSPGSPRQLLELCGLIHEGLLPRDRPLWQIHMIDGLQGGRQALVVKVHHALTDGIGGMHLAQALLDRRRHPRSAAAVRPRHRGRRMPEPGLLDGLEGLAHTVLDGPLAPAGPFNGWVGARRSLGVATLSMDEIRRSRPVLGSPRTMCCWP